jgi:ketosteroid isomerase-like protein
MRRAGCDFPSAVDRRRADAQAGAARLTGTAKHAAGGEMRISMAEVFLMRDGKIAQRRASRQRPQRASPMDASP